LLRKAIHEKLKQIDNAKKNFMLCHNWTT